MRRKRQGKPLIHKVFRIFVIILASVSVFFYLFISQRSWDGKSRFTLILQNDNAENSDIALISIEPAQNRGIYLLIRNNIMLDIPYGYRTYPAYSVFNLGQLDHNRGGGKLLKKSMETTFGIKTDRFIHLKTKELKKLPDSETSFSEFKKRNFNLYNGMRMFTLLINGADTDLNILEKIRFFAAVRNLKLSEFKVSDLSRSQTAVKAVLPDKSEVYNIDSDVFDHLFSDDFQNINVRRVEYTLEVQNATGKEKIAGQFARILNTLGAYVILKTTALSESETKCKLYIKSQPVKESAIVTILSKDYNCVLDEKSDKSHSRSDILVIIGKEFLK